MNFIIRIFLPLTLLVSACLEKADLTLEEKSFFRIYDNADFNAAFTPIDIQQTSDEGYLVLAGKRLLDSNFTGIYLLKVDKTGQIVNEVDDFDAQYVNPVGPLLLINGAYHFVCMDTNLQQAQLVRLNANGEVDGAIAPLGLTYPLAINADGNNILLLSYNNESKEMDITQFSATGSISDGPTGFSIGVGDETEEPIMNHFIQGGRKFPFAIGRASGNTIYYNGFYNYTFSLVFTSFGADNPSGVVYGQQDNGGFSAVTPVGGGQFAAARFNFGDNFLLPQINLPANGITIGTELGGLTLPELAPNAAVRLLHHQTDQQGSIVFASNTQTRQIALLAYSEEDGSFTGSRYLGFANPFEVGSLIQTSDDGMAVCGVTYLAGRFPRICIFKLSKQEVEALNK